MGLAFLSAHTIALERQAGKLSVDGMPQLRDWFVVYPRGRALGLAARKFRDFVTRDGPAFMRGFFGEDYDAA